MNNGPDVKRINGIGIARAIGILKLKGEAANVRNLNALSVDFVNDPYENSVIDAIQTAHLAFRANLVTKDVYNTLYLANGEFYSSSTGISIKNTSIDICGTVYNRNDLIRIIKERWHSKNN